VKINMEKGDDRRLDGLSIDSSIHYITSFRRYRMLARRAPGPHCGATDRGPGRALVTLAQVTGFLVLLSASSCPPSISFWSAYRRFGWESGRAITFCVA
jgi:hypothetical protein